MKTPAFTLKLVAAFVGGAALLASLPAEAGRDHHERRYERSDHRHWGDDHRGRGHARGHYKDRRDSRHEHVVIKEKVIVKHRPVVREYHYYERPYPAYAYSYSRDPAIVIGVNVPPIVIPLR